MLLFVIDGGGDNFVNYQWCPTRSVPPAFWAPLFVTKCSKTLRYWPPPFFTKSSPPWPTTNNSIFKKYFLDDRRLTKIISQTFPNDFIDSPCCFFVYPSYVLSTISKPKNVPERPRPQLVGCSHFFCSLVLVVLFWIHWNTSQSLVRDRFQMLLVSRLLKSYRGVHEKQQWKSRK